LQAILHVAIASLEGALLMTRAEGNADVIRDVSRQIAALFTSAAQTAAGKEAP
jgi:predicted regulator of Ras-like GTPase activity (Roadblock/LC7/MglB family)